MKTAEKLRAEFDRGKNIHTFPPRTGRQGGNGKANGTASYRDFAISAVDLESKHFDPVEYVVADILPVGLAVLSAAPKVGKTWMDMGMSDDIAAGRVFGGTKATAKGDVLLLDLEGNRRRAQRRLRHRMDRGGLNMIREWADDHPDRKAVIIDVWVCFRPPRPKNADPYQFDYETAREVRDLAHELGILIVLVHHNRKAADADFLNELSGSNGLAAAADTILVIKRDRTKADAVLHVTGRDVEECELAMSFDRETCRWSILGDADEYRQSVIRNRIVHLIEQTGRAMSPKEVAEELGLKRDNAKVMMGRMRTDGVLSSGGDGKYAVAKPVPR